MRHLIMLSAALASALPQPAWAAGGRPLSTDDRDPATLECLTQAIYYEARNQSADGQRAVAQVVLNRVRHPAYPDTVCEVVFQGSERTTGCQFSFTCDGSINAGVNDGRAWERAERIAAAALRGSVYRPVGQALNYHTTAIMPYWAPSLVQQAVVGDHIFYRRPDRTIETGGPVQIERIEEPAWTERDSAVLRRTLRTGRSSSPRLRYVGMPVMEIPVVEEPVRFRSLSGRPSVQPERAQRRAAAPQRAGPRMAVEGGVRVSRGS